MSRAPFLLSVWSPGTKSALHAQRRAHGSLGSPRGLFEILGSRFELGKGLSQTSKCLTGVALQTEASLVYTTVYLKRELSFFSVSSQSAV